MPRSAEQQALIDELIEFLKPYKGKSIDTFTISEKIKEIFKGTLGNKTPAKKLGDLRASSPEIFKNINITFTTKGQGNWNKAWKNDPEFRKFFKKKRPGVVWDNISVEDRGIKRNTYESYLYDKAKAKAIPKNYIPFQDFLKKIGVSENNFKEYRSNRKGTYGDIQRRINDLFPRKNFKKEVFYKDPSENAIKLFKKEVDKIIPQGILKQTRTKQSVSDPGILKLHEQLIENPNAKPVELAKKIYKKTDAESLKKIGNDASRYSEVLTGTRVIPGFELPGKKLINSILGNIFVAGNGFFKYGNTERRKAMLKERDKILNTKGEKFSTLRNALAKYYRGSGLSIDETAGLAATYKNAPGYTELIQRISQDVNLRKGNTIDKDFSRLLQKITDGNEAAGSYRGEKFKDLKGHVKLFNKFSKGFQKEYGIDTPIMEYKPGEKLVTSNLVKNFDKLSPEAQLNVSQLADQGIGIRTQAVPIAQAIQDTGDAALIKKFEKRINCASGCLVRTANEQPSKFMRIYESITKSPMLRKTGKFGALAAVGAAGAGAVKAFMNDDPTTYLSNEDQQKNMLIDMITNPINEIPQESSAVVDAQLPAIGAGAVAGTAVTAPSSLKAFRDKALGAKKSGVTMTGLKGLGRGLGTLGTPLGLLATEPLFIGGQISEGDSLGEIATDPINYLGASFLPYTDKLVSTGLSPQIAKTMRLGISPSTLKTVSRRFGLPGLALSLGISGYETFDDYRNKRGFFSEE